MVTDVNCSATLSADWADTSNGVVAYFRGYETPENRVYWWIVDYICDIIYILDIVLVKRRLRFINNGMLEVRFCRLLRMRMKINYRTNLRNL